MITTVTLNPCIDITLYLDRLQVGGLNVAERSRTRICGNGLNVSVVLRALGLPTMCTGISFDEGGDRLCIYLEEQCVAHDFAVAHGNMPTNIRLMADGKNETTEINSLGGPASERVVREYLDKLFDIAHRSRILVMGGGIPNGGCEDIYRRSLERIKKLNVPTIISAEKEPLRQAVLAKPYLIKQSISELEAAFGCKIHSQGDTVEACREIIKKGVKVVCCLTGTGAVIADKKDAWHSPGTGLDTKGFQGEGDAMVAGICKGIYEKLGLEGMLRCGVAAAASLLREGTQFCRRDDFERILPLVKTVKIN